MMNNKNTNVNTWLENNDLAEFMPLIAKETKTVPGRVRRGAYKEALSRIEAESKVNPSNGERFKLAVNAKNGEIEVLNREIVPKKSEDCPKTALIYRDGLGGNHKFRGKGIATIEEAEEHNKNKAVNPITVVYRYNSDQLYGKGMILSHVEFVYYDVCGHQRRKWTYRSVYNAVYLKKVKGFTYEQIAAATGRTFRSVEGMFTRLKKHGMLEVVEKTLPKTRRFSESEDDTIIRCYNDNVPCKEISELLGRSSSTVYARVRKLRGDGRL